MKYTQAEYESKINDPLAPLKVKPVKYTPEEIKYRGDLITLCSLARDDREAPHPEFDEMTYTQYYDTNKRADMSYIPPKKNKVDKRIVTGYTREKDNTLLSALLSYNFQPDITVYDDYEMMFPVLGNHFEDLVKKTREIEQYDVMRPLIYRELISQGDVFVEEIWQCIYFPDVKNENNWKPGEKISEAKFETAVKPRKMERAAVKLHQGKNVYLGSFFQDDYNKQGLVFTYEVLPRNVAEKIYGTWDRWESVPDEVDNTSVIMDSGIVYYDWNLTRTSKKEVGIMKIQKKFSNQYMIMINGVMMLPIDFPLTAISPDGEYTIQHQVLEGIVGCAYGKGQPSKTKVDQAVHDEFLRMLILREEQAGAPPMGYRGKKVLSPNIYYPGKITNNMRKDDLFPILPNNNGLQNADFSMYQLIKTMMDEKTINPTFAGQDQPNKDVTLGQIQIEQKQQLLKLGLNFDSVKNLEKKLVWARIGNIVMNYPKPTDRKANVDDQLIENVYRQFSMETSLTDGKNGVRVFEFTDKPFPDEREHQKEEQVLSEHYGKPTEKVYFNGPEFMKLLKYRWVVNIVPTQEDSDQIERQLFVQNFAEAKNLFGPESLNYEYGKERFAIHIKEDPTKFFLDDGGAGVLAMLQAESGLVGNPSGGGGAPKLAGKSGMTVRPPKLQPVK
jgi:hypothetical protein